MFRGCKTTWMFLAAILALSPALALDQVNWAKGFEAALKQAAKEKKFIVLDISATT